MSDAETRFHELWLGMVQPVEGLVVSIPVLLEAQCFERQPPAVQQQLLELIAPLAEAEPEADAPVDPEPSDAPALAIQDLRAFFAGLLGLTPNLFDTPDRSGRTCWPSSGRR